jgi:hypothetical protein
MALKKFIVKERSFIDNKLVEPGQIVEIDTKLMTPGKALEPADPDDVKNAKPKRELSMQENNKQPNGPPAEPASPLPIPPLA